MSNRGAFEEYLGVNALLGQWSDEKGRYVGEKGNYFSDMFDCWQAAEQHYKAEIENFRQLRSDINDYLKYCNSDVFGKGRNKATEKLVDMAPIVQQQISEALKEPS